MISLAFASSSKFNSLFVIKVATLAQRASSTVFLLIASDKAATSSFSLATDKGLLVGSTSTSETNSNFNNQIKL